MSMTLRIDTAELISGSLVIGDTGWGVRGDVVPNDGLSGWSALYPRVTLPGDAAKEFRALLLTVPSAGTFYMWEDGSFSFIGAPDGTYTFSYRLYVDGSVVADYTVTITIGAGASDISGNVTFADFAATGVVSGGNPSVISGDVALDVFTASGVLGGGTVTVISGNVAMATFAATGTITGVPAVTVLGSLVGSTRKTGATRPRNVQTSRR